MLKSAEQFDQYGFEKYVGSTKKGNHFRNWIHKQDSNYAKKIDLDRSHQSWNTPHMRKAWMDWGKLYVNEMNNKLDQI